jgi:elongation factor P
MIKIRDLGKNNLVEINGAPHKPETITIQSPSARGGTSLYKIRFRNIVSQNKVDLTLKGEDTLPEVEVETRDVELSFDDGETWTFVDTENFEQYEITKAQMESVLPYLADGLEGIRALVQDGQVLAIQVPDTVAMPIVACDPSIKGASATARTKPATLPTGLIVQVPEYLSTGDVIRIDTRNDSFVGRA